MKTRKNKVIKPDIFVIGLIYGENNKVEAVSLYERDTKKGYMQSIKTVGARIQRGEQIHGVNIREEVRFNDSIQDFKVTVSPYMDLSKFDHRKMNVLNGAGQVIFPGKDVIIGTMTEDDGTEYCVVVDSDYKLRKVKREDAIKQGLLGTFRNTILKVCKKEVQI